MKKVYVYYETNHGKFRKGCYFCSDIHVYSDREQAKQKIAETLKIYAGTGIADIRYNGCNRYVIDNDELANMGITVEDNDRLTGTQIDIIIDRLFDEDGFGIQLFADKQENWGEYFIVNVDEIEIE